MFDYSSFTNEVIKANKELYEYINTHLSSSDFEYTQTIGFGGDKTLNIDLIAEKIFIKYLKDFGDIFSEEVGLLSSNSNIKIIIDPLDGSHNFLSQLPYYGTSIAVKIGNEIVAGYVCNLVNGILTYRDDNKLNKISIIDNKIVENYATNNREIAVFERAYAFPKICEKLYQNKIKYRSPGAVALSLSEARNFQFVLFAGKIREFDIAASLCINNDLFIHYDNDFLIITKNEYYFTLVKEIINLF
jgi:myo-inositol-1(or 4)-monophosphatase